MIENKPLEYSVLNPETSSDSPSEKSNGGRLVSARQEIIHRINKEGMTHMFHKEICLSFKKEKLKEFLFMRAISEIKIIEISYEMVCLMDR
jgi:hypothetical protein